MPILQSALTKTHTAPCNPPGRLVQSSQVVMTVFEIYQLEQLLAFAECGTLSGAAERLHLSQPALSRSMQRLEA